MNKEIEITSIPEVLADTRRVCAIRFDCMVRMHDVAYKKYQGTFGTEKSSKTPQWFKAEHVITLETVKYADPYEIGMRIKEMFRELEKTIEIYEG
jgi:hypothetical protein